MILRVTSICVAISLSIAMDSALAPAHHPAHRPALLRPPSACSKSAKFMLILIFAIVAAIMLIPTLVYYGTNAGFGFIFMICYGCCAFALISYLKGNSMVKALQVGPSASPRHPVTAF